MKKRFFSVVSFLLLVTFSASALEWGGLVKNNTDVKTLDFEEYGISQDEELYIWGKVPFGKQSPFSLVGELVYKGIFDFDNNGLSTMENIIDVDIFKIAGNIEVGQASSINMSLGRFYVSDSTRKLFSQLIDGGSMTFSFPWIGLSFFGGFTGFINSHVTPMMEADGIVLKPNSILYSVNIPYLVGQAKIEFPYFMGNTLSLEALGFFDTRDFEISRYFGELSISGPLNNSVFYKFDTIVGFNNSLEFSNYTNLTYFSYPFSFMMINFGVEYASGKIGPLNPFYPVTSQVACSANSHPALSGVLIPNAAITISTGSFYTSIGGKFLFSWPDNTFTPSGGELSLMSQFNILSDIKVNISVDGYYDITGGGETNYSASLGTAISL